MKKIGVIGLGYVGLPLAHEFAKKYSVIGFDLNLKRINELKEGWDRNNEIPKSDLKDSALKYTNDITQLNDLDVIIVTVPTPISSNKQPDLRPLISATETVGKIIRKSAVVVYESTVYPGTTEDICIPIIEKLSGLKLNEDFYCGYSPERINPGDKAHSFTNILKVTSGSNQYAAELVDQLYSTVVSAGTYRAPSIKVAEAAKVIENTQRDLNIALMNELSIIFNKMGIDTHEVIEAASTKWNFLKFFPGLVGGHCIGVDPYYLAFKANELGIDPKMTLSARVTNDSMPKFIAEQLIRKMLKRGKELLNAKILIMGIGFKEDCPDVRNTKVIDIYNELTELGMICDVFDPVANEDEVEANFGVTLVSLREANLYDAIIIAVKHKEFIENGIDHIRQLLRGNGIIFDLKGIFPKEMVDFRL